MGPSLGIQLDSAEPSAEPEGDRLRQREGDFVRQIPWGAALLSRLLQDDCTPTLLESLDDTGASWVLQARPSEPLREAFALAPEIRILVASGRFDGGDLLRAAEHPVGAERVDPDLLIIAADRSDRLDRLPLLPGPWGQRIPWLHTPDGFTPLAAQLRHHVHDFDLFHRLDQVHGHQLIGREDLLRALMVRLVLGQAVGVFGLRKVGKSSLLQAAAERLDPVGARLDPWLPAPARRADIDARALVISLDVQLHAGRLLDQLVYRLAQKLHSRLEAEGLQPPELSDQARAPAGAASPSEPLLELEQLLRFAIARSPLPVCVILDEYDLLFEGYGGEPGTPGVERLFGLFRTLAQETRRVSVALIGRDPDFVQRPLMGGFANPLLTWCEPFWLGPLRRDEGDELLRRLGRRVGLEIGPRTMDTAWRWTAGHPLLLRQYGSALLELANQHQRREGPFATDGYGDDAAMLFQQRYAVLEILREVRTLLSRRFPDAMALFQDLTSRRAEHARAAVASHGGWEAEPAQVLRQFGLLTGQSQGPQIAEVFRRRSGLASLSRPPRTRRVRTRHGS